MEILALVALGLILLCAVVSAAITLNKSLQYAEEGSFIKAVDYFVATVLALIIVYLFFFYLIGPIELQWIINLVALSFTISKVLIALLNLYFKNKELKNMEQQKDPDLIGKPFKFYLYIQLFTFLTAILVLLFNQDYLKGDHVDDTIWFINLIWLFIMFSVVSRIVKKFYTKMKN
ncbi:hypothetical protein WQ57_06035 [Mesobacillus campisalis]|uniref:Uncharacterized protein n=1 Tax=Mesobacillus campisalis TaxID=1408103 RepID=A0A0M2T0Z8_9BACI|nr:hypothetical protein [Mesobacillus campisalis]KKK38907.1 hypothetical protein WQ57_06035 [Mesobacillus campisalis]